MTHTKALVLDANILLRAAIGVRVFELLESNENQIAFYAPTLCFEEARRHLPAIAAKQGFQAEAALIVLDQIETWVDLLEEPLYLEHRQEALDRLLRDPNDWPIAAAALTLDCPIWTEDLDFFGCGIPTWTTANIPIFFRRSSAL